MANKTTKNKKSTSKRVPKKKISQGPISVKKKAAKKSAKKVSKSAPKINKVGAKDFTETSAKVSVAIKIIFFSTFIYLFSVALFFIAKWVFLFEFPSYILGVSSRIVGWVVQIAVLAIGATISTKMFLIDPINKLKTAMEKAGRGNFRMKANYESNDEIGDLVGRFNSMLDKLADINTDKDQTEYELLLAREELKYKARLEKRGQKIKEANKALESLVKDFSLLYEIGQRINSTIEMSELYRVIEEVLPDRLGLQKFAILLTDKNREFLKVKAAYGFANAERIFDISFRIGEGISGEVATNGDLIYVPDIASEPRFLHYRGESQEKGSLVSVPLKYKNEILGVMNCSRERKRSFSDEEIRLLTLVANQIALAVENAQLYTKTRDLSVRDELTKLYNRRYFQGVLQMEWKRATRFKRPLSLLMVDIDHFKEFNDTYGHPHGDKVLQLISDLLVKNIREVDTIARFGGEEFVALLPDTDKMGSLVVGEKLRRIVEQEKFNKEHHEIIPLTISVGISVFPEDAKEMDDLIDHADVALYEAKDGGRNRVVVYGGVADIAEKMKEESTLNS